MAKVHDALFVDVELASKIGLEEIPPGDPDWNPEGAHSIQRRLVPHLDRYTITVDGVTEQVDVETLAMATDTLLGLIDSEVLR